MQVPLESFILLKLSFGLFQQIWQSCTSLSMTRASFVISSRQGLIKLENKHFNFADIKQTEYNCKPSNFSSEMPHATEQN